MSSATIDMGQKVGRGCCGGHWVPTGSLPNVAWAEAYLFTKWHLDPCNRLATIVGMPHSSAFTFTDYCYPQLSHHSSKHLQYTCAELLLDIK